MKKELNKEYYNNAFETGEKYKKHYSQVPYKDVWSSILDIVKGKTVADFGCGTGQFIEYLIDNKVGVSYGVDFSDKGIDYCNRLPVKFYCDSLYDNVYELHKYNVAIFLEVLEHLEDDQKTLSKVPKGKEVIITVPSWDSVSHCRHFNTLEEVEKRYKIDVIYSDVFDIGKNGKRIFLIHGIR